MVRKKKSNSHGSGGIHAPPWMVSWADMTTLLWACFVLLWSFSTLDLVKFHAAMSSLQGALGVLEGGAMVLNKGDIPVAGAAKTQRRADKDAMERLSKKIGQQAKDKGYKDTIQTSVDSRGLMIRFSDTVLFDPGSIQIKPEAIPILNAIAAELSKISNPIQVEGHTDPTPINTPQFPSNWELSTGRATAVIHYLIEQGGVAPEQLSAAGYAFYHPVAPNNSPEGRAKNRRVDVIVLNEDDQDKRKKSREEALRFLESAESTGIIMPPSDDENFISETDLQERQ